MNPADLRNPPAAYRPVAMWFLNGRLEDGELRRQVRAMAEGGLGAIQIAARTGLETPYLSDEWFRIVELVLDEAHEQGLRVWLADEYPYPSGATGGEVVLRHPEFRAWRMRATRVEAVPGESIRAVAPGTVLLRACAVPIHNGRADWSYMRPLEGHVGLIQHEQVLFQPSTAYLTDRRYMANGPQPTLNWRSPTGSDVWEVWLIAAAEITDYKFFGSYVDLCNPEASQYFLKTTYERYLQRLGPAKFGQLAGFFVDESHPQNWSWCLPEFFQKRRGYDLVAALPALWTDTGPATARVRYDYRQSITELFVEGFHRPLAEWCRSYGVALSLEVPSMRNVVQRYADVPGIDPGHDKVGVPLDDILARELPSFRGSLGFPASLAAQTGRQRVLDELFHSVGWSLTLQDMKAMLDRAAARGANLFAFHAFCYTIGGLRKWDAPPSEFDQNPYWTHYPQLSEYAGRLAYALSRGRRVAPVALVDPITSIWTHEDAEDRRDPSARTIGEHWMHLMRELIAVQRQFDNLDPLMLAEASVRDGVLIIGDAEYRVVVLPSMTSLESIAWERLEHFAAEGGTVIATGTLPTEQIEVGNDVASRMAAVFRATSTAGFVRAESSIALLDLLDRLVPPDLTVISEGRRNFLFAQRRDGDQDIFLIANSSMEEQACEVMVRGAPVARVDLDTGETEAVPTTASGQVRLQFPRHGAQLLIVGGPARNVTSRNDAADIELDLDGEWRCELVGDSLNALRLDRFRLHLDDETDMTIIEPKPLINVFQDVINSGRAWPGQFEVTPIFGAPPRIGLKVPVAARYAAEFEVQQMPPMALLCIEDYALQGEWEMRLNDQPIDQFIAKRRWSNDNREADITPLLRLGRNRLELRMRIEKAADGLVDALHVLGDFGVQFDDAGRAVLVMRPEAVSWAERHTAGYPYFSGTIRLSRALSLSNSPSRLRFNDEQMMFAGVAQLSVDGRDLGVRAWAPYVWDLPADPLRAESATVTVTLATTLLEQLEGKRYDPKTRLPHRCTGDT